MPKLLLASPVERLFRFAVAAAESLDVPYAIGGGIAVQVHGYRRETGDVDLFVLEKDHLAVIRALRGLGLTVEPVSAPALYEVRHPDITDPDIRIDLLTAVAEPELSAVEYAQQIVCEDLPSGRFAVFPVDLLILAKFYADQARHELDIDGLLRRGAFDPMRVRTILAEIDPDALPAWETLIERIAAPRPKRPRPKKRLSNRSK